MRLRYGIQRLVVRVLQQSAGSCNREKRDLRNAESAAGLPTTVAILVPSILK